MTNIMSKKTTQKNKKELQKTEKAPIVEEVKHVITQEDLDANPELISEGIQVGETVILPPITKSEEIEEIKETAPKKPSKSIVPDRPWWMDPVEYKRRVDNNIAIV